MVLFGSYALPYVQEVQLQTAWAAVEKTIPFATVAWRRVTNNLGRTVVVVGYIKSTVSVADFLSQVNTMRGYVDGTKRLLDLQDGTTPTFNAIMTNPQFTYSAGDIFAVELWAGYQVTFLETT